MHNIKISVVIPVYNVAPFLKECLDSIVNQSLKEIEIICVDDGSTDSSLNILEHFAAIHPSISIISQENAGQSAARNRGFKQATGQYIYFMDADDKLDLKALEQLYRKASENDLDVLYFDGRTFYEANMSANDLSEEYYFTRNRSYEEITNGPDLFLHLKNDGNYIVSPCLQITSREHMIRHNIHFYEGIIHEDNLFAIQCLLSAARASHLKSTLFNRRVRANSTMTQSHTFNHFYGYFVCFIQMQAFCQRLALPATVQQAVNLELSGIHHTLSKIYYNLPAPEREKVDGMQPTDHYLYSNLLNSEAAYRYTKSAILLRNIYQSKSYKLARLITYLPRLIRNLINS
ncbi:MAG: hypothetical protein CMK83_07365 [Pseudomonadales bacterium]|jgi:glycosyltransferase involved in cell wall biosynthesis|uniref:glycosyltransferase n=1 Tax=unclassified Ketobacter TaxID=2639109 RepID=UPI000C8ABBA9|nr:MULTISPECIES: glycosyltransferase [unclassified Ketobacter]MAA58674.1 hypothetical protein [Pseudomonadales bacterium]MEC8813873.1 glycosyltransferase [Pseudomonadota bacterium]TNC90887.1 MAG: hypothetical protein CSH49_00925 [Alcanivorax sp.]HAG92746.1 hypothetical protein [Gammaproteobacteria bacterium]MAQ24025.1 hypothetical protein [Pseudomonadales bacterium]|tara:strand:+ start:14383 stop:15420 length:1038 start_codon:yes stop_codon:yes gene_type:complete